MKYRIEIEPLTDYYVVAVKEKETGELKETFTLNETGAEMLRFFCQDYDIIDVAKEIASIYDIPIETVMKDVQKFAERLRNKRII